MSFKILDVDWLIIDYYACLDTIFFHGLHIQARGPFSLCRNMLAKNEMADQTSFQHMLHTLPPLLSAASGCDIAISFHRRIRVSTVKI